MTNLLRKVATGHIGSGSPGEDSSVSFIFTGDQSIIGLGPKQVTTEACPHRFGDSVCGGTILRSIGRVSNYTVTSGTATVDVQFNSALPFVLTRYLAGIIEPLNGMSQGNANDITDCTLVSGTTYRITLGALPRVAWQINTAVVVGNGCRKTLVACNENGRLQYNWATPFTPGTKSFTAGSMLVNPSGPNIP